MGKERRYKFANGVELVTRVGKYEGGPYVSHLDPPPDYLESNTRWFLPSDVPAVWRPRPADPEAAFRERMAEVARIQQEQADVIKASLCPCGEMACACPRRPQ